MANIPVLTSCHIPSTDMVALGSAFPSTSLTTPLIPRCTLDKQGNVWSFKTTFADWKPVWYKMKLPVWYKLPKLYTLSNECAVRQFLLAQWRTAETPCCSPTREEAHFHGETCHSPRRWTAQSSWCAGSWSRSYLQVKPTGKETFHSSSGMSRAFHWWVVSAFVVSYY